mgnify:CR=1 FL=1
MKLVDEAVVLVVHAGVKVEGLLCVHTRIP